MGAAHGCGVPVWGRGCWGCWLPARPALPFVQPAYPAMQNCRTAVFPAAASPPPTSSARGFTRTQPASAHPLTLPPRLPQADGSQTAFLDGNQPDRLCAPIVAHVEARGGVVKTGCPVKEIELDEATGEVARLHLASGEKVRVT